MPSADHGELARTARGATHVRRPVPVLDRCNSPMTVSFPTITYPPVGWRNL
ncbi:MAG: hypothetical protein ACLQBX_14975 [Candidatus Limnocylindrales bacterium]